MKIAVGVCGLTCSGKDTVIELLAKYGFKKYSYTNLVLKPVSTERNLPHTRDSYRALLTKLGPKADEILFACVKKDGTELVGIPNIRLKSSVEFWRNKSGYKFYLVKTVADLEKRYKRWIGRNRDIDKNVETVADLQSVDDLDKEVNDLGEILEREKFDFIISNNASLEELKNKVEGMTAEIL